MGCMIRLVGRLRSGRVARGSTESSGASRPGLWPRKTEGRYFTSVSRGRIS